MEIDKQELINYFKTKQFQFTNSEEITDVDISCETYNPLDNHFVASIKFNNGLQIEVSKELDLFKIKVGKNSGWVGGIDYTSAEQILYLKEFNFNSIKIGFDNHIQKYTLCKMYSSGSVDKEIFTGTTDEIQSFAKDIELNRGINKHFIGTFKENYYHDNNKHKNFYKVLAI